MPSGGTSGTYTPVFPTPIRHVFVVVLENEEATSVLGNAPYETHLAHQYAYAQNYFATTHPSAPNYLSITSGSYFNQSGSDAYHVWKSLNIADLVQSAGETWASYDESMPAPCDLNDSYPYAVKHNPLTFYSDIVGAHASRCNPNDLSFAAWNASVSSGNLPNYAILSPNLLDDGHDTGLAYVDSWLSGWLPPLINNSAVFSSSVFFIVYDEGSTNAGYNGTAGGNVFLGAVSPYAHMGYWAQKDYSHWNLLTTTEWLLGLTGHTYHNDNWTQWPPMKDLFTFPTPAPGPSHYILQGTVWGPGGSPVAGATVSTNLGNLSTTAANGTYRFSLLNGSYSLTASAAGYATATAAATISGGGQTVDFNLTSGSGSTYTVSGTTDTSYPASGPLGGVSVFLNASGGGTYSALSSASGTFQLQLPNGTYALSATAPYYLTAAGTLSVSGGPATTTLTLAPRSLSVTVQAAAGSVSSGRMDRVLVNALTPGGQPATGAVLALTSSPLALPFSPVSTLTIPSNGTGFVSFVAPTVSVNTVVTVSAGVTGGSAFPGSGSGSVTVAPAGSALPATVTGFILNASSGAPLSGATVQVIVQASGSLVQTVTSGTGGGFTASGLTAASYTLSAQDVGYYGAMRNVTTPAGATIGPVDLNLTPTHRGGALTLSVSAQANPTSGPSPLQVAFTSTVSGGSGPYTYLWNFGDGGQSVVADPTHVFGQGSFTVSLTVTDSASPQQVASTTLTVSASSSGGGPGLLGSLTSDPLLLLGLLGLVAAMAILAVVLHRRRGRSGTSGSPRHSSTVEGADAYGGGSFSVAYGGPGPEAPVAPGPPPGYAGGPPPSPGARQGTTGRPSWANDPRS